MLVRLLKEYLRPHIGASLAVVGFQLVATIASLYLPTLNADIIDNGVTRGDVGYIVRIGALMLAVSFIQVAAAIGAVYFGARTAMQVGQRLRGDTFTQVQSYSAKEMSEIGTPSLITRTTNDVQQIQMLVLMSFTIMLMAPIMLVGGVLMALRQDVTLSGLLLAIIPVLVICAGAVLIKMVPAFRAMQTRVDAINRVLREQLTGLRVIRAFVREDVERERFGQANTALYDVSLRTSRLMALMFPLVTLIINVASIAVLWFGGSRIDSGHMQVGALTAFLSYLMYVLMAIMMSTMIVMMVPRAAVSAERLTEVLDLQTSVVDAADPVDVSDVVGRVEFAAVGFRYPGAEEPVLTDISFVVEPAVTTAIIGSTGSGKTTLLNVIPRLFDVTDGAVTIDGIDIRDIALDQLWALIGIVPQKPYLFSGTIASNLRYGRADATDDEIWAALEVAQAASFVREMPQGLDSVIAQGGTNVSGGQRQRLAIARAVIKRPRIYLFDDSFSALDYSTDLALRNALGPVTSDAAVLIVAQRVATIRHAHRIIVLDDGRIVGSGTHEELMATNATYQEIVSSQLSAAEAA